MTEKIPSQPTAPSEPSEQKPAKKSNVGLIIIIIVIILVVLGAGGYFASRYFFKAWFESKTGISVDEKNGKISYDTDEGSGEIGENLEVPSYWPSDVPIYSEDSISSAGKNSEDNFYLSFTSGSSVSEIYDWYLEELPGEGWTISSQMSLGSSSQMSADKNDRTVSVMIYDNEEEEGALVTLTVAKTE